MTSRLDYVNDPAAPKPNSMVPAAGGAIFDIHGRILLVQRADNGLWALPGGKIEIYESVSMAVEREVKEETGLHVIAESLIGIYSDPDHIIVYANGEVRRQFFILCRCRILDGELSVDHESNAIAFFSQEDVLALSLSPNQRQRIEDAYKVTTDAVLR